MIRSWFLVAMMSLILAACSTPPRLDAVPTGHVASAEVTGIEDVRYFVYDAPTAMRIDAIRALDREQAYLDKIGHEGQMPTAHYLALSGGGDNGAFGAGLLVGWGEIGTRPQFKVVTGVSTGALTAPFAFLGSDYDDELRAVYTTISPDDIYAIRGPFAAVFNDAMADNKPLRALIERFADRDMLIRIAEEYEKGRFLLIATTNLDAKQAVIWNIGKIAANRSPKALQLFQDILVASAAVPGVLPPVMIEVTVGGTAYHEMHVDGGTTAQVFLYPPSLSADDAAEFRNITRERKLFLIRNARLDPEFDPVKRQTLDVVSQALVSLIQTQGIGDLYRVYSIANRDQIDYNLAYITRDFDAEHPEEFDTDYMNALFDYGYALAKKGYPWLKAPPDFAHGNEDD